MSEDYTDVPTESGLVEKTPEKRDKDSRKNEQALTFARPPFAREIFNKKYAEKFDKLTGAKRQFLKKILEHGDINRAANEVGKVGEMLTERALMSLNPKLNIVDALEKNGVDANCLTTHLVQCLNAEVLKFDKHGNAIQTIDLQIKLKTIEMILKIRGDFDTKQESNITKNKEMLELFEDTDVESND